MASNQEVLNIIKILLAAFPRFTPPEEMLLVYQRLLCDIPGDVLQTAALECATKRDFFPSVHELRETVIEIRKRILKIPNAYDAWNDVMTSNPGSEGFSILIQDGQGERIEKHHHLWLHPLVEKAARLLGWPHYFPEGNLVADRAHFFKTYETILNEALDDAMTIPDVQKYIELNQAESLESGNDAIHSLAESMRVK